MTGDPGPYVSFEDSDIWVPRTVPYLEARSVARSAIQEYGATLRYIGKTDSILIGFTRDCRCDEACELANQDHDDYDPALADTCRVPAWHFREE